MKIAQTAMLVRRMVDQFVDQSPSYTFQKRGILYFSRRVPADLQAKYRAPRIVMTLRTRSEKIARKLASSITARLGDY